MGRRIKDVTFTVTFANGVLQHPYIACTVEVDVDGEKAQIQRSGTQLFESLPDTLQEGLKALITRIVADHRAESIPFEKYEEDEVEPDPAEVQTGSP